ncbi:MAG: TIGR00159 family protein [Gemmatimonadetes bacterium]|jgi:diadenylate cyclase|nr:TIGR00159 family protein [Gemmatimonadota bacterium]
MQALLDYLGFLRLDLKDVAEILIVSFLLYRVLVVYTGTRAFQVLIGFVVLVSIYVASQALQLRLIPYLLSQVFTYGAFALIVIFQPELRAALARLGRTRLFQAFARLEQQEVMDGIAEAADRLAKAKIGGIIAVEQEVDLLNHVDHGTPIDAILSTELLTTVFTPYSPLHDGAVIVKRDRIAYAGSVILRLSESPAVERSLGTRHRAALGLSEETDALVVVISEETGQISLAHEGRLYRGLRPDELRQRLKAGGEESSPVTEGATERDVERPAALSAGS